MWKEYKGPFVARGVLKVEEANELVGLWLSSAFCVVQRMCDMWTDGRAGGRAFIVLLIGTRFLFFVAGAKGEKSAVQYLGPRFLRIRMDTDGQAI